MIELRVKAENYYDAMALTAAILQWLTSLLAKEKKNFFNGFLSLVDKNKKDFVTVLMCEMPEQVAIHNILLQPPGEFKGKYTAHWVVDEPVLLKDENSEGEEEGVIKLQIEDEHT